jgi:carbon starvation protein
MTPALAAAAALLTYTLGYRYYARWLSARVFELNDARPTPAHTLRDEVDYVPTPSPVLFGHHFASIAGLAPMLGPAIAVIWGWLPAMVWVVLGALLIGCVHDLGALVLSARAGGRSIGSVAEGVLGPRARVLFLCVIFFGVSLAMGVFVFVIAQLFARELAPGVGGYPEAAFPSVWLIGVAAVSGWLMQRRGVGARPIALVGFPLMLIGIWAGLALKSAGAYELWWPTQTQWILGLLAYAFAASVLPVWSLLQPRDFLNSLLLYLGLGLAYLGLFMGDAEFDAPAFDPTPAGAPPLLPFVFILVACGAASGFHGLVSSGTTAKQLDRETDARAVAYGGMIGESLLGLLAVLACTAGFSGPEAWRAHYASFHAADGLATKLKGFIDGTTSFLTSLHLPEDLSAALVAMVVVSFALTTLDSATRLLRFNIEELLEPAVERLAPHLPAARLITHRYTSSLLACGAIATFAFYEVNGKPAALALWALFGTTNQLLAGLTLTVVTLYLRALGKPTLYTGLPALFMLLSTFASMGVELYGFATSERPDGLLVTVGAALLALGLWIVAEAALALRRAPRAAGAEGGAEQR